MDTQELVRELNICFTEIDHIAERFDAEKLKTIRDGYLCVTGLMNKAKCPANSLLMAALAMRDFIEQRWLQKEAEGRVYWGVRLGLHVGPVVAGVVGKHKFAFDIWGDTVNIAARLETAGMQSSLPAAASPSKGAAKWKCFLSGLWLKRLWKCSHKVWL